MPKITAAFSAVVALLFNSTRHKAFWRVLAIRSMGCFRSRAL
jgi:hypothetical protein